MIGGYDFHAESEAVASNHSADAAQADNTESAALEFAAEKLIAVPISTDDGLVGLGNVPEESEKQAPGVFGSGGDGFQEISFTFQTEDGDAAGLREFEIDVVEASCGGGDGF